MDLRRPAWMVVALLASFSLTACGRADQIVSEPGTSPTPHDYTPAAFTYFQEVAFGTEFGGGSAEIKKWTEDVRIGVRGDPNATDRATLEDVIDDLNLSIGPIEILLVSSGANATITFAPEERFSSIEPGYIPVNMGFFYVWWDADGRIYNARILISTTGVTQGERNHLIREELTQSLGLMRDSSSHEDSVFYQDWTATEEYSDLDGALIEMLYLPEVKPGMTATEAVAAIRSR